MWTMTMMRQNTVNDFIRRALASADIPTRLEPPCLSRDDWKRSDGLTLMLCAKGGFLVWDFTCNHTLAASFINRAVLGRVLLKPMQKRVMPRNIHF
jgi:hypothetical protein